MIVHDLVMKAPVAIMSDGIKATDLTSILNFSWSDDSKSKLEVKISN